MNNKKLIIATMIAIPILFFLGMVGFGRLGNDDSEPTVQPSTQATQEPVNFNNDLRTVYVDGVPVAIKPDSRQLILENEPQPQYAIGVNVPINTVVPTPSSIPPTPLPGQQIVQITQIVQVTQIVEVTRIIEVTATPNNSGVSVIPQVAPTPTPNTPATSSDVAFIAYEVRPGDTLSGIAQAFGIDVNLLAQYNTYTNLIYPGEMIRIPRVAGTVQSTPAPRGAECTGSDVTYTVRPGNTVYGIAALYNILPETVRQYNGLGISYLIYPDQQLCIPR